MNCCESTGTDCEQGRRCPKRAGHPIPIELLQPPRRRRSNRLRTWLLTTLISLAAAIALGLVAHLMHGATA